jgi:hypothetical protein
MFLNSPAFVSVLAYAKKYSEILEEAFFNDKDQFSSSIYWYCFQGQNSCFRRYEAPTERITELVTKQKV